MITKHCYTRLILLWLLLATALVSWGCKPPAAKLKVSQTEIKPGEPVTLSWETQRAKAVDLNGEKVDKIGARTVTPAQTTTYELVAQRGKKSARDSQTVTVTVVTPPSLPTISLRADMPALMAGQSTTLRWESAHADAVTISGLGEVAATGERAVNPSSSTTYRAEAKGAGGSASASVRITVSEPPPPETPPAPTPEPAPAGPTPAELFATQAMPVYFALDRSSLSRAEQEKLRSLADWLLQTPTRSVVFRIEGMCDPRGTAEYNLGLGERRARAVREFLLNLGVEAERMETISYGLEKAEGRFEGSPQMIPSWAHDRRAEFVYLRASTLP